MSGDALGSDAALGLTNGVPYEAGGRRVLEPASESTAGAILLTAAALFRRDGYSRATTRQLGDAVGIRGPSVYYHFKSKEDILLGICIESLHRLSAAVRSAASDTDEAPERLSAMIETHVRTLLEDGDMHTTALMEMRWLSEPLRQDVTGERDAYEAMFRAEVADAQASGAVRTDVDARALTLAMLGLLNWTVFWYRSDGELAADEIASLLLTILLEGAIPRDAILAANEPIPGQ